jgi:hypothetical protein
MLLACSVPKWEEYPHTPAVFVRAAAKGLTGYVKWKSAEAIENKGYRKWRVVSGEWRVLELKQKIE